MSDQADKRVLIVDDDHMALLLVERHLSSAGYEVLKAENGVEALRIIMAVGPQIVITDWSMPQMTGPELIRSIRENEHAGFVYTIVLTAHHDEDRLVAAFEAGADDYLLKPVSRRELVARVRAAERIVRLERDLAAKTREGHLQNAQLAITNDKLNKMAITDELTGLFNRRAALNRLSEEWATTVRNGQPMAVIALDIDHFKHVNDTYGHDVGDLVLKATSDILRKSSRLGEAVCRVGGEEFLILCPMATVEMAARGAERMRAAIEGNEIQLANRIIRATISCGVAERLAPMELPDDLLKAADDALYVAKRNGRNRVQIAGTSFAVTTAANEMVNSLATPPPTQIHAEHPARPVVLLIASSFASRNACRGEVVKAGYEIVEARTVRQAISHMELALPDVIMIDTTIAEEDSVLLSQSLGVRPGWAEIPVLPFGTRPLATSADAPVANLDRGDDLVMRLRLLVELGSTRRALAAGNAFRGEQAVALEALLDYSNVLAGVPDLDGVLDRSVKTIGFLARSRQVAILLPDDAGLTLRIARGGGIEAGGADRPIPIDGTALGRAFEKGERLVICGTTLPEELGVFQAPLNRAPLLAVPLITSGQVVGLLYVSGRIGSEAFTPLELGYVDIVAQIAASVIHGLLTRQSRDEARDSIVVALAKLAEYRDNDTGGHVERVTRNCVILAQALRRVPAYGDLIDEAFIHNIRRAAPMHDIGKVGIPDQILLKPGRLTPEETAIMRRHCEIGGDCLRSVLSRTPGCSFLGMAIEIAEAHHEWYDGNGYPRGLRGTEIPLAARIAALADVYDALRSRRPYKEPMDHTKAREIILQGSGKQFDPGVVEAFLFHEGLFAIQQPPDDETPMMATQGLPSRFEPQPIAARPS